jgi:hypothetical protein
MIHRPTLYIWIPRFTSKPDPDIKKITLDPQHCIIGTVPTYGYLGSAMDSDLQGSGTFVGSRTDIPHPDLEEMEMSFF